LATTVGSSGVVPEKWANYTLQINLRGFSGRYMTVARQKRNRTCEREAKSYRTKRESNKERDRHACGVKREIRE